MRPAVIPLPGVLQAFECTLVAVAARMKVKSDRNGSTVDSTYWFCLGGIVRRLRNCDSRCVCSRSKIVSPFADIEFLRRHTVAGQLGIPGIALDSDNVILPLRSRVTGAARYIRPAISADARIHIVWPSWIMRRQALIGTTSSIKPLLTYPCHPGWCKQKFQYRGPHYDKRR